MVLVSLVLGGCQSARLSADGPYKDPILFRADQAITTGYKTLHAFVKWEYANRQAVDREVTRAADHIRENASNWIDTAIILRDTYAANPNDANRSRLEQSIAILEAALNEATKYLVQQPDPSGQARPPVPR
jgi:hypothetical protein